MMDFSDPNAMLTNVRADVNALLGGPDAEYQTSGSPAGGPGGGADPEVLDALKEVTKLLNQVIEMLGGDSESEGGSGSTGGTGGSSGPDEAEAAISGTGRIWGDPHFIGQDGGKYDVQGEAGKTYNLLSDRDFQMNGEFHQYGNSDDKTVVGEVGISAGSSQVEVNKDGTVMVDGEELKPGDKVQLENGGFVEYHANGGGVTVESGEWTTEIDFQNKGDGNKAHLNIDVSTDNAISDGVKPHGLLGQTFDADDDARNGDKGGGVQGGGAIEDANGNITERGDREAIELYEVDNIHDRNFTEFNQFFDDAEALAQDNPGQYDAEVMELLASATATLAQSILLLAQQQNQSVVGDATAA